MMLALSLFNFTEFAIFHLLPDLTSNVALAALHCA